MWNSRNLKFHKWNPDPVILEQKLSDVYGYDLLYISYLPDAFFSFVVVAQKRKV
jgi:hypothetical protein